MTPAHIIIHHSLSTDQRGDNWSAIKRWHVDHNGWDDIGYHFGTERRGHIYINRIGRPEHTTGAHTLGLNDKSLGWCFVGNYDEAPPAKAMLLAACVPIAQLCLTYVIPVDRIEPHNKYAEKSCPGRLFSMHDLRRYVSLALAELSGGL